MVPFNYIFKCILFDLNHLFYCFVLDFIFFYPSSVSLQLNFLISFLFLIILSLWNFIAFLKHCAFHTFHVLSEKCFNNKD